MSSSSSSPLVLVTGASGFLAGEIINQLLQRGIRVRGTVRNAANAEHIKEVFPSVELFEADLLKEGSFDKAVEGVDYVFHTASPFILKPVDPIKDLVEPAVNGTLNVLKSVEKSGKVKRVVLTSSVAAVLPVDVDESRLYSGDDWSDVSSYEKLAYKYSKTKAEQAAWEFQKGKSWELVVLNPTFIIGPPHYKRADAESIRTIKSWLDGDYKDKPIPPTRLGLIDVRDVAYCHIEAAFREHAKGRYTICTPASVPFFEIVEILAKHPEFSRYPLPKSQESPLQTRYQIDSSRAIKDLGFARSPYDKAVIDMATQLVKLGIVKKID
eukprot:TRINITY_DN1969_c0_g2_i2.p1 TRINITY_DN1969_c0_g2~~TRINITY_DN1969_c0_g2_i2.p1  ORF type:complete len:325 (-),score=67.46 TRINITY_DN1969_c0_g2_i2:87-1061(-)